MKLDQSAVKKAVNPSSVGGCNDVKWYEKNEKTRTKKKEKKRKKIN